MIPVRTGLQAHNTVNTVTISFYCTYIVFYCGFMCVIYCHTVVGKESSLCQKSLTVYHSNECISEHNYQAATPKKKSLI